MTGLILFLLAIEVAVTLFVVCGTIARILLFEVNAGILINEMHPEWDELLPHEGMNDVRIQFQPAGLQYNQLHDIASQQAIHRLFCDVDGVAPLHNFQFIDIGVLLCSAAEEVVQGVSEPVFESYAA